MRLIALLGAVALLAGCGTSTSDRAVSGPAASGPAASGQAASGPAAAGSGSPAPAAAGSGPVSPAPGRASGRAPHGCAAPGPSVTITDADNGGFVCVTAGGELTLRLTPAGWKKPAAEGGVLAPTGATTFKAVSAGKTTITSSRAACPAGTVSCHALQAFQVRIVVS